MAKAARKRASRHHHASAGHRKGKPNPHHRKGVVVMRHKRQSRPNPFGGGPVMKIVENTAAALLGLGTNNLAMNMVPSSFTGTPIVAVGISAAIALGSGYLAAKVDKEFGLFLGIGSMMAAGQLAINSFAPSLGSTVGLSGLRDFVPGKFAVPQNPVLDALNGAGGSMGGGVVGRAYPSAYAIAA